MDQTRVRTLLVIPARGGSKGIARKNLQTINGRPLVVYAVRAALRSGVHRVIVSTDDEEIRGTAVRAGAEAPFLRPPELARDEVSVIPVLRHALEEMQKTEEPFEVVCSLQPTAPLITPGTIQRCLEVYAAGWCDSVVSVRRVFHNHPYRVYSRNDDGVLLPLFPEGQTFLQRQDLPSYFALSGGFYLRQSSLLLGWSGTDFALGKICKGVPVSESEGLNIDSSVDLELARLLLRSENTIWA